MTLNLRKTGGNALSILTSDAMNRATSFFLYALVARHLGAHEFGQLALALTLFYTFQVLAVSGLKTLIIRQVTKDRALTGKYFVNAFAIVFFSSLCSLGALFGFVRLMHYPGDTALIIVLLGLGLLPYAISAVCEGIFQAWERMSYIPLVNVPINAAKVGCAFLVLSMSRSLYGVVWVLLCALVATAGIELWILVRRFQAQNASFDLHFSLDTMRSAFTFLGIDSTIAIMSSLNILFLSKLASETEVGLYGAATQLMVPLLLVYQSFAQSIFPVMCRKAESGFSSLKQIAEQAIEMLLVLALPGVIGLLFFGQWLISVLYKNSIFLQAYPALQIIAWILVSQVFTAVLGQVLVASHREKVSLKIVIVDTLVNLVIGWPLIRFFGLRGAAISLVVMRLVDCVQHYVPVSRLFSGISLAKIVWKPMVAASCMVVYLALDVAHKGILTSVVATLIYAAALLVLAVLACGGVRQFREKYLLLLSARG